MEIWPLLIKHRWSISDMKVYILFVIQQTWRHTFASEETALRFDVLQTSLPNHKNLGIGNTKVESENTQISVPDWKDAHESCNIIILISKLLSLVVCFLIPGAVSEPFVSWWKDRSFASSLNHAVTFVPAKDLWHLSRFDPGISQNQNFQWKLFNYTNKNVLSKPLMEVEQIYFQPFLSASALIVSRC